MIHDRALLYIKGQRNSRSPATTLSLCSLFFFLSVVYFLYLPDLSADMTIVLTPYWSNGVQKLKVAPQRKCIHSSSCAKKKTLKGALQLHHRRRRASSLRCWTKISTRSDASHSCARRPATSRNTSTYPTSRPRTRTCSTGSA